MALACSSLMGMRILEFDICAHSFPRSACRPASVIRTRATLIDLPQLFPEDCGFLF
jgi:hypothetical protein